ncbi:MAG TPA: cytochrome P450, partial [Acidimicrobiales bacterium]|nr:cytochrome P450 [Acidimicrobiales bacterium]
IGDWQARISEIVAGLLGARVEAEPFDVVSGLAAPLPVRVIAEMLGADADAADQFRSWADVLTRSMSGSTRGAPTPDHEATQAILGLAAYLAAEIEDRQRTPRADLLGVLVRAHGEDVLEQAEALGFAALLLFAGTETTTNLIGNAVWALLTHPGQLDRLAEDPQRLRIVLEETLRWESPVQYVFRRATAPFERHGVEVPVDSTVTLLLGAANRDPRHFGDTASDFDPDRTTAGHVGFGFGPHFCLGAALARAEASLALGALDLRGTVLVGSGLEMIDSMQFRGRRRLEIGPAAGVPATAPLR